MTEQEAIEILSLDEKEKKLLKNLAPVYEVAIKALEEVEQYRAIGTPEEYRAAVEKQRAKKPKKTESEGYRYTDTYRCPNCEGNFSGTGIAGYCYHCGQKLDWSDEE